MERTLDLARKAADHNATVALFRELGVSAYSNEDLFHQGRSAGGRSRRHRPVAPREPLPELILIVGAPLRFDGRLFNCAVVMHRGKILGVVPKTFLPNYREVLRKAAVHLRASRVRSEVELLGETVPFGSNLLFCPRTLPGLVLHVEICEDVWAPIPPQYIGCVSGCYGDREPFGQQHHDWESRIPAQLMHVAIGEVHCRLPVLGGGSGKNQRLTSRGTAMRWRVRTVSCSPNQSGLQIMSSFS